VGLERRKHRGHPVLTGLVELPDLIAARLQDGPAGHYRGSPLGGVAVELFRRHR